MLLLWIHIILVAVCADPCLNGGICTEPDVCQCSGQYGGQHCEISNVALSDSVSQDEESQTGNYS